MEIASRRGELVTAHAHQMYKTLMLPKNACKGHWGDIPLQVLLGLLETEIEEFRAALWGFMHHDGSIENILSEAADCSNFLAMICDNCKREVDGNP